MQYETNQRIKSIWERFLNYELGHFHFVMDLFRKADKRDPEEVVPMVLPEPIDYVKHREFVREVLRTEVHLRAKGTQFIHRDQETSDSPSVRYRDRLNAQGSPSTIVAEGYRWKPGTELASEDPLASDQEEVA
jgi:hypothetical protein